MASAAAQKVAAAVPIAPEFPTGEPDVSLVDSGLERLTRAAAGPGARRRVFDEQFVVDERKQFRGSLRVACRGSVEHLCDVGHAGECNGSEWEGNG